MSRLLVLAISAALAAVGCADGWPRVHQHKAAVTAECKPTTTRIGRLSSSCVTTNPMGAESGEDVDRDEQSGQSVLRTPVSGNPR
jgi:hypothetical protein